MRLMAMRQLAQQFGRPLYCHRNVANGRVTTNLLMPQALREFTQNEVRALLGWLHRQGPFWEEARVHEADQYLECNGEIVTDTAVGEAGYNRIHGIDQRLVSLSPSDWEHSPIVVRWVPDDVDDETVEIPNYFAPEEFEAALEAAPAPIRSWNDLDEMSRARFANLTFSAEAFNALIGYPFAEGAASRLLILLKTLDQLKTCFDENGQRTAEGHRIYQDQFTGDKARFSDSSDDEKRMFENDLTFPHPGKEGDFLFCPMHGKEKSNQLRIHFSSPITATDPLFIVYVGRKITMR